MANPDNLLQNVETYNNSNLAFLENSFAFINKANKKFKNFQDITGQLGDTVTFDKPPRYTVTESLVADFQASEQRVQSLKVDKEASVASSFSAQQDIFNVRNYMDTFGKAAVEELGTHLESDVAQNCISHTYRHYGNGVDPINSYAQLATALALFRNYGAPKQGTCGFLDDIAVPAIVGTGQTKFVPNRNDRDAMSWEVGTFSRCEWFESNLLPTHTAGVVGETDVTLVVTAVVTETDGGISAITCSGGGTETNAIKEGDLLTFQDDVSGETDVRYRTFVGHKPSQNTVQIRATADASSSTDSVTIPIFPYLYSAAGNKQNVTTAIGASMELKVLPSHRAGLIYSGNPMFMAMPRLPNEDPFMTVQAQDKNTGSSIRMYSGSKFGLNERGTVHDCIWGSTLADEYAMRLVFPL